MNVGCREIGKVLRVLVVGATVAFVCQGTVCAERLSFMFRSGAWSPASEHFSIAAPCHAALSIKIFASRYGSESSDVPILVEIRRPGVALNDPPSSSLNYLAKTSASSSTYSVNGNSIGCTKPWTVQLKPKLVTTNEDISGSITFSFSKAPVSVAVEDAIFLGKGKSVTKNIGGAGGFSQGWVEVSGKWKHSLFGAPGPLPVKLNFELLRPDGTIADYDTGYTSNEINPCCSGDKIKVRFLVRDHATGQWKLRIRNDTGDDVMSIDPTATYTPSCQ